MFPTDEDISISKDTNFILLPIQLPTYRQHVNAVHNVTPFRLSHPCPFILHTNQANELVHDMDYYQDNRRVMPARQSNERNIKNWFRHTNPDTKKQRLEQPLDITARIRVYKFNDLFPEQARQLPSFPRYSKSEFNYNSFNSSSSSKYELQKPWMSEEEFKKRLQNPLANVQINNYNQFMHRQYTFLEITPANSQSINAKCNSKLKILSKYLEPSQLTYENFAQHFNFTAMPAEVNIQYLMDNADVCEFSPAQIKSGIKRLKNIIKYMKPKATSTSTNIRRTEDNQPQSYVKPKFNQHVRTLNIKQSDWTYRVQVIEDLSVQRRTSLENTKPLSINDLPSWTFQQ